MKSNTDDAGVAIGKGEAVMYLTPKGFFGLQSDWLGGLFDQVQ